VGQEEGDWWAGEWIRGKGITNEKERKGRKIRRKKKEKEGKIK
jgi:hypothetical protein